jgi:hypothetical protein
MQVSRADLVSGHAQQIFRVCGAVGAVVLVGWPEDGDVVTLDGVDIDTEETRTYAKL